MRGSRSPEDGSYRTTRLEDLDVSNATFSAPGLTVFCRLDGLGVEATGQHVTPGRAVLECRIVDADDWCRSCGGHGLVRGSVSRGASPMMRSSLKASGGLIDDPVRFDGVTAPGVDEHCWGHTRGGAARTHRLTHGTLHDEVHLAPHDVPHGGTFCRSSTRTGASSRVSRCGPARRALARPGGQTPAPFYAW